ncbi:M23 family metallopeptidase [Chitinophaga agrisoli]|uniref:M23 family metallopeptidase n=1 Tax=Chitinophaga agrisoli TaxID=2607653 RepID=A0A5B2VXN1_9BACT|nr:M23 family metallopeptidase [Chitinophaga agrisoli]KAA2243574.1 M23 family metallopeptidase [Chitinophaga agrisoli]
MTDTRWYAFSCIITVLLLAACTASKKGLFTKKTAHEAYAARITDAGLQQTALGNAWFTAAQKALARPLTVTLPYKETGYFAAEKPDAAGFMFSARRGERIDIAVSAQPGGRFLLFADLWQLNTGTGDPTLLGAADTTTWQLRHEVEKDGRFVLRLQPELLRGGNYTVTITTAPTLAFPVPSKTRSRIGSFWGDARDQGGRKHEGIDIFGTFRTPVVAAANGYISRVGLNNLGGKVIFMQPEGKDYTLYYAHLDSQLVRSGQQVMTGDTLGLMGNTGNAKNTPTHLHFGIYTTGGAMDPMPFVNVNRTAPAVISADTALLHNNVRNKMAVSLRSSPAANGTLITKLPANQVMQVLAATDKWYKVLLPDNREGFVESVTLSAEPYRSITIKNASALLAIPDSITAVQTTIPAGASIRILGAYNDYDFVRFEAFNGWIKR